MGIRGEVSAKERGGGGAPPPVERMSWSSLRGASWLGRPIVVLGRVLEEVGHVLRQDVALGDEIERRRRKPPDVFIAIPVALLDRQAWIAGAIAIRSRAGKRNVRSDFAGQPVRRPDRSIAIVP